MVILYGVILPVHAFFFQVLQFLIEFKNIFRNICWIWTQIWHSNTGSWKPNILLISCSHFNSITHNELKKFTSVISHYLNNNCTKSVSKQTIKSGWELKVKKTVRAEIFIQKTKKKTNLLHHSLRLTTHMFRHLVCVTGLEACALNHDRSPNCKWRNSMLVVVMCVS